MFPVKTWSTACVCWMTSCSNNEGCLLTWAATFMVPYLYLSWPRPAAFCRCFHDVISVCFHASSLTSCAVLFMGIFLCNPCTDQSEVILSCWVYFSLLIGLCGKSTSCFIWLIDRLTARWRTDSDLISASVSLTLSRSSTSLLLQQLCTFVNL